jgi:hypothetical protein
MKYIEGVVGDEIVIEDIGDKKAGIKKKLCCDFGLKPLQYSHRLVL